MAVYLANALKTTVTISTNASQFSGCVLINLETTPSYLQLFDTAGAVTLGTTVPRFIVPLAANATAANGSAICLYITNTKDRPLFTSGTMQAAVTTAAEGNTAIATGLFGSILYE